MITVPNSTERALPLFAGIMLLLSMALTHWVHADFIWLTGFIGVNLIQAAFTGFCPATWLMHKLGLPNERQLAQGK
ncbi:DUF2892 domain-containing protein [uncultured Ferrimonas sp.]|uniref:YgaP family membrane protein n=1 Tax=uncultured Ferrimonas sp. TaxID=432640 RepID=UPI00260F2D0F|nr:DUF2892 domain-containing protein [uncultured Ferrimonas sp.]